MTKKLIDSIINFIESNDVEDNIIKEYIDKIVNKNNPTIRTVSNRYSLIKKNLIDNFDGFSNSFLSSLKPDDTIMKQILVEDMERRCEKCNFNFTQQILNDILNLKNSEDLYDLGIYLQFISGRRSNEIYKNNDIKINRIKNKENIIKFSNLKNNEIIELIPNTLNSNEYKKLYNKINNELDIPIQIYINRINVKLKNMFPKSNISSHKLRGCYVCFIKQIKNENENENESKIKNENDNYLTEFECYSNYKFIPTKEESPEKRIKKKLL